jgi:hypothetical protein
MDEAHRLGYVRGLGKGEGAQQRRPKMARQVLVLGAEEGGVCECCGKTNLKKVVVLEIEGEVVRYGCDCASKAIRHAGYYAGRKITSGALWETARWARLPASRREMAGYHAEVFKFQTAA